MPAHLDAHYAERRTKDPLLQASVLLERFHVGGISSSVNGLRISASVIGAYKVSKWLVLGQFPVQLKSETYRRWACIWAAYDGRTHIYGNFPFQNHIAHN